ncbi:DUF6011 domain-containing protein [Actinacidiphila sp. ITFR-21]|uniref:DUF6011 domain-containing protein n=1 Tax=Actinacidiphila sp. ITFR-21 TaxID=3075199 RepID=UPI00288B0DE1|nr:DUF6011 domain-containing protein [Streptomyces sp. ITFR-21]WNI20339.1 DUF6011 domain-containing protein [Streptomyces sp. ITFR-21]
MATWPELDAIPEGYYAVLDPHAVGTMTYWRRVRTAKAETLRPWPAKAWHGPAVPRRADLPELREDRDLFVAAWQETYLAYLGDVAALIAARPEVAARCFSSLCIRCWSCGRPLLDKTSKTYGIGPDCRAGTDPVVLARYCTPAVGRAHAACLAAGRSA